MVQSDLLPLEAGGRPPYLGLAGLPREVLVYLRRQVVMNTKKDFLVGKLRSTTPCIVFTSYKRYNRNKELFGKYLTVKKYGKVLLSNFASRGDGREGSSQ